ASTGSFSTISLRNIVIDESNKLVVASTNPGIITVNTPAIRYGDVTGNGVVNVFDAQKVLDYVVGTLTLPDASCPNFTPAVADVSGNGTITSYDAALIFQYSVGLISQFPVEQKVVFGKRSMFASSNVPVVNLAISSPQNISGDIYKYDVQATDVQDLMAGEFGIACDPAVVSTIKDIQPSVRNSNIQAQYDGTDNTYKVAMTTNDRLDTASVKLFSIFVQHKAGVTQPGLHLAKALLNEGKISSNFPASGLLDPAASIKNPAALKALAAISMHFVKNSLRIENRSERAFTVRIYNMLGRMLFNQDYEAHVGNVAIALNSIPAGLYICSIKNAEKTFNSVVPVAGR
ncbi:MAG: dockerin type I domain-containing protein, partial [Chitinivibrionales bacterium]|nr:dockerin type I domain-containing protein [Chitinivibrionales bacterium]